MIWEVKKSNNTFEYLVLKRNVSVSTQKQALNALAFLFNQVWKKPLDDLGDFIGSKRPRKLPVVLSRDEVRRVFQHLKGTHHLMTGLLYGGGLRLMECVTLRILDVDFDYNQLLIRNAKGFKDRIVPLPERFKEALIYTHVLNTPGISVRSPADMI